MRTVFRYERNPPAEWIRPGYIPSHLRHAAEYIEVSYPDKGTAKIWRLPRELLALEQGQTQEDSELQAALQASLETENITSQESAPPLWDLM